jgi:hypothetical protein
MPGKVRLLENPLVGRTEYLDGLSILVSCAF